MRGKLCQESRAVQLAIIEGIFVLAAQQANLRQTATCYLAVAMLSPATLLAVGVLLFVPLCHDGDHQMFVNILYGERDRETRKESRFEQLVCDD